MRRALAPIVMSNAFALVSLSEGQAQERALDRMTIDGVQGGRIALAKVCLPAILGARSIEALAIAQGMLPASANEVGGGKTDKAWRLGLVEPAYAVAWSDGGCTALVEKGSRETLRAMAESEILGRPEGFKRGSVAVVEDGRLERSLYCAQVPGGWALVSITVAGPKRVSRTRALSSTVYLRPTPSALCTPG